MYDFSSDCPHKFPGPGPDEDDESQDFVDELLMGLASGAPYLKVI